LAAKKIALKTQKILKRDAKIGVPVDKMLSTPLDPLTRGFAPGPHWGHSPQAPI